MNTTNTSTNGGKFAQMFEDDAGRKYLFIRTLGKGYYALAQQVLHLSSNQEVLVRKVLKEPQTAEYLRRPDPENVILRLLESEASKEGVLINIIKMYSHQDMVPAPRLSKDPQLYQRVSMLHLYNGGDLKQFKKSCRKQGIKIPRILILRLVFQIATALRFMLSRTPALLHRDLHHGNVFLDWSEGNSLPEFILADFGSSNEEQVAWVVDHEARGYATTLVEFAQEMFEGTEGSIFAQGPDQAIGAFDDERHENAVRQLLKFTPAGKSSPLEVFDALLALAPEELTKTNSKDVSFRMLTGPAEFHEVKRVKLYDTAEEAIAAYDVVGPWRLVQVNREGTDIVWTSQEQYGGTVPDGFQAEVDYDSD